MGYINRMIIALLLAIGSVTSVVASGVSVAVGPTLYRETYEEFDRQDQKFMQEEATMYGVDVRLGYALTDHLSMGTRYGFAAGRATYTGSLQHGQYGDLVTSGLPRYRHQLVLDTTYRTALGTGITAGIGWRRLDDHMDKSKTGYRRVNDMTYASLGVDHPFRFDHWAIVPAVTYKHLLEGNQYSDMWGGIDKKQTSGNGYDLSIALVRSYAGGASLKLEPFLRTWDIADSEKVAAPIGGYIYEPRNKTREVGLNVSWMF